MDRNRTETDKKKMGGDPAGRQILWAAAVMLAAVVLGFFFGELPAQAAARHVYDEAGILTGAEIDELEQMCAATEARKAIHILLVTAPDTAGKTQEAYADDFYDAMYPNEEDEDGVLVLIDMGERQLWISTAGTMRYYLSDREIDEMLDDMVQFARYEQWQGAFAAALTNIQEALEEGISEDDYLIDENGKITRYKKITLPEFLFALAGGLAAFAAVIFGVKQSYRKKVKTDRRGYARAEDLRLGREESRLIDRYITTRHIPPPDHDSGSHSHSGGGSSTHTSSSGRSHGGGGRGF